MNHLKLKYESKPATARVVNIPVLCLRSQYLPGKRRAMNSCSLCEMTFYVMFTFSLFILRGISCSPRRTI